MDCHYSIAGVHCSFSAKTALTYYHVLVILVFTLILLTHSCLLWCLALLPRWFLLVAILLRGHDDASSYQIERDSRVGTLSDSLKRSSSIGSRVTMMWVWSRYKLAVVVASYVRKERVWNT